MQISHVSPLELWLTFSGDCSIMYLTNWVSIVNVAKGEIEFEILLMLLFVLVSIL